MVKIKKFNDYATTLAPIILILLLVVNLMYLVNMGANFHKESKGVEKELALLSTQLEEFETVLKDEEKTVLLKQDEEMIEFLKSEYENFQSFANSDRESFFNLINLFFVALGVLVTGATIVLYWLFGQSREEVRENAKRIIETSVESIKTESQERINEILQPKITEIEGKYQELLRIVDSGYKLKNSKFALVCSESEKQDVEAKLLGRLRAITETQLYDFDDFDSIKLKLNNKEIDIIIYVYKPTYEVANSIFKKYIQHLIDLGSKIPIITYVENGGRVEGGEAVLLNQYPYSSLANIPTTLTTNIIAMANLLSYEGGTQDDC